MHKVIEVEVLENFKLLLTFSDQQKRIFDATEYLNKGVFIKLRNGTVFNQAYVQWDTVCWPGELDISPDTLYIKSKPIDELAA
ncbi:DUF2442 domain-containing protein [Nitrincola schmidtii]|uniref:DUF2442 domain-containing protein n=1 Tax=Nitrincola schmidtii TaxID=1730894 RepID=UPI00124C8E65|nr:DUF2442 domain-containing protein [Nitrincola schmidtii]